MDQAQSRVIHATPAAVASFQQADESIAHFSIQLARAILQIDEMKSGLTSLYAGKQQLVSQMLEENGINPNHVLTVNFVDETGKVVVTMNPTAQQAAPAPSPEAPAAG